MELELNKLYVDRRLHIVKIVEETKHVNTDYNFTAEQIDGKKKEPFKNYNLTKDGFYLLNKTRNIW